MNKFSYQLVENSSFPETEHRIAMIQVEIPLMISPPGGPPSRLGESEEYKTKLLKALSLALGDNWANIVVFPEISVPAEWLLELMEFSWNILKSRGQNAGGCLVCLPLEHLSLSHFYDLIEKLINTEGFVNGDSSLDKKNVFGYLLQPCSPGEQATAFVNVAALLVFDQSGLGSTCRYFFQPKLFPYPLERTPKVGRFLPANLTYIIGFGATKVMTVICFDLIAQPPGSGFFLSNLLQEVQTQFEGLDYLLVPQCNSKPLDNNFQRSVVSLYHHSQVGSQTLRIVSPNVARFPVHNESILAGQSWFVTCPFGNALPSIGIWERSLVSVLKDPCTEEIIRDAPSLGQYAQRLRLTADGEWLLNLLLPPAKFLIRSSGPNVPLVPHKGTIYEWHDTDWVGKDPKLFEHHCRYAERLPGLRILVELPEWIQNNFGGKSTYSPSYAEFASRKVHLPQGDRDAALSLLRGSNDVWVGGKKACGKTVFGLGIAFEWMAEGDGRCLFFDLKDKNFDAREFIDLAKDDIDWFVNTTSVPLLLVLDNVHAEESIANKLLEYVQKLRRSGMQIQALLLGRNPEERTTERSRLFDNQFIRRLALIATEEAFQCAARRLSQRIGIELKIDSNLASVWVKECGGDLVVFAAAFDPTTPERIDRDSISRMALERYIIPAMHQPGGLDAFLDLCVLSSLDMDMEDAALWERSAEAFFPVFVADGTVSRAPMRMGNPRSYCRLFHPSLGELVLRVRVNFSELELQRVWLNRALDICYRQPYLVSLVHHRLATGNYGSAAIFSRWLEKLNSADDLTERAFCYSPFQTMMNLRRENVEWTWGCLKNLPESEGYHRLVESLTRTPAGFIAPFLNYLVDRGLEKEGKDLLTALLENEEFTQRCARTPAGDVVTFLKYLESQGLDKEREHILAALLKNEEFKQRLARTPAHFVVTFLKYLVDRGLEKEGKDLLAALLENEEFTQRLARTPAGSVVTFLKYLDSHALDKDREDILTALLENEEFTQLLARMPAGEIVTFLKYLDSQNLEKKREDILTALLENEEFEKTLLSSPPNASGSMLKYLTQAIDKEKVQIILDKVYGTMDPAEFERQVSQWPPDHSAGLQRYIREGKLSLPPELWRTLIRVAYGGSGKGEFLEPAPDPEYPQDKLLGLSITELQALLKNFAHQGNRYKMNCIVKSLISDEERLQLWIKNLPVEDKALLRETLMALDINIPPKSWELLDA